MKGARKPARWTGCLMCEGIGKDQAGARCAFCGGTGQVCRECQAPPWRDGNGKLIPAGGCWHQPDGP